MKKVSNIFKISMFFLSLTVMMNAQDQPFSISEETLAHNMPAQSMHYLLENDTLLDPSASANGEIMGLENAERKIKPEGTKDKKRADKLYRDLGFEASSKAYRSLSRKERKSEKVLARIANSHRLNHETEDAEFWYAKFVHNTNEPKHLLHYAQVLQSNGKCEDAVRWYKEYKKVASKKDVRNRKFMVDCSGAEIPFHPQVNIYNVEALNTKHLDFSPIPYGDGIVFTSTRGRDQMGDDKDNWTSDNFTDLFFSEMDEDGKFSKPVPFIGEVNGRFHDGTASFNKGNSIMVFTRNNTEGKVKMV